MRVFCNVTPALRARDVMASCKRALGIAKQGGTAGISILWPVLDTFEDGSFYLSSLPPIKRGGEPSKPVEGFSVIEVKRC